VVLNSRRRHRGNPGSGNQLRQQKIRVKEVVRDVDEDDVEFDENWHVERVCKVIEKVRRLHTELQKVEEKETSTEAARKKVRNQVATIKQEMIGALQTMRLNRKQIDRMSPAEGPGVAHRAAQREIADCEQRAGMPERSFRKTLPRDPFLIPTQVR